VRNNVRMISLIVSFVFVIGVIAATAEEIKDACALIDLPWLQRQVPLPETVEIVSKKEIAGLCEVVVGMGSKMYALYAGKDFIIVGEMYKEKQALTEQTLKEFQERRDKEFKDQFPAVKPKLEEAVAFRYGPKSQSNPSRTIYMFTDPLCSYCTKAGEQLKDMADKEAITIKAILFNVHGEKGRQDAIAAVCRKYDLSQYLLPEWKSTVGEQTDNCDQGRQKYDQGAALGKELGIHSVPYFITDDGAIIRGADLKALTEALSPRKTGSP
jgi:thiol:disulfide interchange protein DsbC